MTTRNETQEEYRMRKGLPPIRSEDTYAQRREASYESTVLSKLHKDLYDFRYNGALDEGQDLRTNLINITNTLLDLLVYLRNRDESE